MYTDEQIKTVIDRVRDHGMLGLLQPPPGTRLSVLRAMSAASLPGILSALLWWLVSPATFEETGVLICIVVGFIVGMALIYFAIPSLRWFYRD